MVGDKRRCRVGLLQRHVDWHTQVFVSGLHAHVEAGALGLMSIQPLESRGIEQLTHLNIRLAACREGVRRELQTPAPPPLTTPAPAVHYTPDDCFVAPG